MFGTQNLNPDKLSYKFFKIYEKNITKNKIFMIDLNYEGIYKFNRLNGNDYETYLLKLQTKGLFVYYKLKNDDVWKNYK